MVLLALGAGLGSQLVAAPASPAASSSSGAAAIADCRAHGRLTASYTVAELQNALATMPVDVKQYSDCYDVIQNALQQAIKNGGHSGSGSSGGSGGSFLPTWLIVVIVLLVLGGITYAALAIRRRRAA